VRIIQSRREIFFEFMAVPRSSVQSLDSLKISGEPSSQKEPARRSSVSGRRAGWGLTGLG